MSGNGPSLTVDVPALKGALASACRPVMSRMGIPVLECVLLESRQGVLSITGTDLDRWITATMPCEGDDLVVAVPAARLRAVVAALAEKGSVATLETGERLTVRCGRSTHRLPTVRAEDFPRAPACEASPLTVDAPGLSALLARARSAASDNGADLWAHGVRLQGDASSKLLRASATDRHRGHRVEMDAHDVPDFDGILHGQHVADAIAIMPKSGPVSLAVSAHLYGLEWQHCRIVGKMIDAQFPDLERLIPAVDEMAAILDRRELIAALRRVLASADKDRGVTLSFTEAGLSLSFRQATSEDHCDVRAGAPRHPSALIINGDYVIDALEASPGNEVAFQISGPGNPVLIRSVDEDGWRAVLMPMRG